MQPNILNRILAFCLPLATCLAGCDSTTSSTTVTTTSSRAAVMDSFPTQSYLAAQLAQEFTVIRRQDDPNPALHYRLMVPKEWQRMPISWQPLTPDHPSQLQEQVQAPTYTTPVQLKLALLYLPDEVSPADLLLASLDRQGDKIVRQRFIAQPGGAVPDILTVSGQLGHELISRWTVRKNALPSIGGAAFFVFSVGTSAKNYSPEIAQQMGTIINQFELLHPSKWPYSEQLRTLVRTMPTRIETVFPRSWQQVENPRSDEHFYQVKLIREQDGKRLGIITLSVLADQTPADKQRLEEQARAGYEQEGAAFEASVFTAAPDFGGLTHVQQAHSLQLDPPEGAAQERHVVTGQAGRYWVHLEIVQYTREAVPVKWAIANRGYEIVRENLVVQP